VRLKRIFFILLILGLAAAACLYSGVRSYRVFTQEELVAVVRCEPAPAGASYTFLLQVAFQENGRPVSSERFPMVGDQWAVGGDFLKWSPRLNLLGVRNRHKLTRLSSRYWTAAEELKKPRAAYDLNGGSSAPWLWLYRYGIRLPFVDAVYGTTAYIPAREGEKWGVYAGQDGYLLRPLKGGP
jgi:hypothetical protein